MQLMHSFSYRQKGAFEKEIRITYWHLFSAIAEQALGTPGSQQPFINLLFPRHSLYCFPVTYSSQPTWLPKSLEVAGY